MAELPHGLHTLDIGSTTAREVVNAALEQLDPNRIKAGLISARPAAGVANRFYYATDQETLYFDNGSTWDTVAGGGGGGIDWTASQAPLAIHPDNYVDNDTTYESGDFDHNGLDNTHNLTTDIDHNALANYQANEHIDLTSVASKTPLAANDTILIRDSAASNAVKAASAEDLRARLSALRIPLRGISLEGLAGLWRCDSLGVLRDQSGRQDHMTESGSGTTLTDGKFGNGLRFNSAGLFQSRTTYIASTVLASHTTVSLWLRRATTPGSSVRFFSVYTSTLPTNGIMMYIDSSGRVNAYIRTGGTHPVITHGTNICDNTWHHACLVIDRSNHQARLYVDGAKATFDQDVTGYVFTSSAQTEIGGWNNSANYNGDIDEVAVFARALSENEIRALAGSDRETSGKHVEIASADEKASPALTDEIGIIDRADSDQTKRATIAKILALMAQAGISGTLSVTQPTLGQPVAIFESEATNDNPQQVIVQGRVQTSGDTPTTILTIPLAFDTAYYIEATIVARAISATGRGAGKIVGTFYRPSSGDAAQEGSTSVIHMQSSIADPVDYAISGGNVLIRVKGVSQVAIVWHCTAVLHRLST